MYLFDYRMPKTIWLTIIICLGVAISAIAMLVSAPLDVFMKILMFLAVLFLLAFSIYLMLTFFLNQNKKIILGETSMKIPSQWKKEFIEIPYKEISDIKEEIFNGTNYNIVFKYKGKKYRIFFGWFENSGDFLIFTNHFYAALGASRN